MSYVPTLGYWNVRGLAQPIRLLLRYTGTQFNEKVYKFEEGMTYEESVIKHWNKDKHNMGLDFPNLPYYMEGDFKLSQSLAILKYLARKHGLVGTDNKTMAKQEMVEQQLHDFKNKWFPTIMCDCNPGSKQKVITEVVMPYLQGLSTFLAGNKWFVGQKISYVDFIAYETLEWMRLFTPETFNRFDNLMQFLHRFENLPQIKAYMKSSEFIRVPIFGPGAKWGSNKNLY